MRTKNLFAICIFTLLTVNLVHAGWPSVDPHAENYYPQSPYTFVGGNPVSNVELDGKDWYRNENGDMMWRRIQDKTYTDDNGVVWTNAGTTYLHQRKDGSAIYFSQDTNDDGELTLSSHSLSKNEMSVFGLFHSEKAKMAAIEDHVNPSAGSFAKMVGAEMAAQWTDPYLLTAGVAIGVTTLRAMSQPTKPQYSPRVRMRGVQDPISHNFPYSYDNAILNTHPQVMPSGYKIYQMYGTMNGKRGVFEIGMNQNGIIDHRFFRPVKQ